MNPYRYRLLEPNPGDAGPGQAWFEACRDVARRLDDGEDEASIVEWLEANYGTQTTSNVSNTS